MSRRPVLTIAIALVVLIPVGLFATVSRAQVPDALYYVGVINSPQIDTIEPGALPLGPEDLIDDSTGFAGVLSGTACESGGGCETSGASASAGVTVSASGSSTGGTYSEAGSQPIAGSQGLVDISFEVIGPGNVSVPLLISGAVSTSAVGPEAYALASIGWGGGTLVACSSTVGYCGPDEGGPFPKSADLSDVSFMLQSNTVSYFGVNALGDSTNNSSYSAMVDPYIQIDPTFMTQYPLGTFSLVFSSNVNLSSVIPEPSTWAMMLLGFVGLGYAGYRRERAGRPAPAT
jgi:hypothetical protein